MNWRVQPFAEPADGLRRAVGGHPLVAQLLAQRGISDPAQARAFLDPSAYTPTAPEALHGMATTCERLQIARAGGERVRVWGDLDADGQTATAVLVEALQASGIAVDWALPLRGEGHGLHPRAVSEALRDGIAVLLTCDTGIGDADVAAEATRQGLDLIITDHHDLPDALPPALAIVNPKTLPCDHPLRELSGVGVAYLVASALLARVRAEASDPGLGPVEDDLLDLVALGLVADVSTLVGDVRYLVQRGLERLRHGARPGLVALAKAAGIDLASADSDAIGYALAPRMNAAGRLADAAEVVRLLLTKDADEATASASRLEALNRDRQARTDAMLRQVQDTLALKPELTREPVIVLDAAGWEPGVLGLVAGALARDYQRPAILIAHRPGEPSVASARSVAGFDIHEAIAAQSAYLLREGGHPMAAGFSIAPAQVPAFRRELSRWLAQRPAPEPPPLCIDAVLPWAEVDLSLAREITRLAPFGPGNPAPVFAVESAAMLRAEDVSRRQVTPHRRLYFDHPDGNTLSVTWFNAAELPAPGETVDVAFRLDVNRYRGEDRLQLLLVDWRPSIPAAATLPAAPWVAGRAAEDWRSLPDAWERLRAASASLGQDLAVWGENAADAPVAGALTRAQLPAGPLLGLAILSAPPDAQTLRAVLEHTRPQTIYLLPSCAETPSAEVALRLVAGMARVALSAHEGWLDLELMATRIGLTRAVVMAAVRVLESTGQVTLRFEAGRWRIYRPEEAPPEANHVARGHSHAERSTRAALPADADPRATLSALLRDVAAYRRAYLELPLDVLLLRE